MNETINYEQDAKEKLAKCGGKITIRLSNTKDGPWFTGECRPHYRFTIRGPGGSYTSDFWASIQAGKTGKQTTAYDILTCLQWYEVGSHAYFCAEFGYDCDSIQGLATWKACCRQYAALCRVFPSQTARESLETIR